MHTHMNDTAFLLCPEFKLKKKKKKKKKINLPTLLIFRPKRQTNLLFFLDLITKTPAKNLLAATILADTYRKHCMSNKSQEEEIFL